MKKFYSPIATFCAFCFLALFGLTICACVSSKAPDSSAQEISVGGVLQTNDRDSYFIIVGGGSKSAKTFFFVKDEKNAAAWKQLLASVGQKVFVSGKVVDDGGPWLKTVAVKSVSLK